MTPLSSRLREAGEGATPGPWMNDNYQGIVADAGNICAMHDGGQTLESILANRALVILLRNNLPRLVAACALAEAVDRHVVAQQPPAAPAGVIISTRLHTMNRDKVTCSPCRKMLARHDDYNNPASNRSNPPPVGFAFREAGVVEKGDLISYMGNKWCPAEASIGKTMAECAEIGDRCATPKEPLGC